MTAMFAITKKKIETKQNLLSKKGLDFPERAATVLNPPPQRDYGKPPIKIGFVVHAMQVAGAEILVEETINHLRGRIEPTIFCLDAIGTIGERLLQEGIPVICMNRKPKRDFGVAWRLAREIRQRGIQVVHAHQYSPFFYAALAKLVTRNAFRLILTEHGRHYPDRVSALRRGVNRLVLDRLADDVNACCRYSAKALCRNDGFRGNRIHVIQNGIDLSRFQSSDTREALRDRFGFDPSRQYIGNIARFHPVKDHAMLLRAFQIVAARRHNVDLILVGDGPLRDTLKQQVANANLQDRVRFLGVRRDVPQLLQALDLFALTSISEAASLTLLEAMAASKPVVITDVGGNPEIVRNGMDGYLVPRGQDRECAAAMLNILDNPNRAKQMGESGSKRVKEKYILAATINAYHQLYTESVL